MDAHGDDAEWLHLTLVQAMGICGFRGCGEGTGPTISDKQDYALTKLIALSCKVR